MLLAIETSSRQGSVAILDGEQIREEPLDGANHGAALAKTVRELVPDLSKIDAYAISIGPGSFTGLRIGVSFLKGLAYVHRRPAVPVSTLEVIATQLADAHPRADCFLPILDARKGEVFAALYRRTHDGIAPDPRMPEGVYRLADLPLEGIDFVAGGDPLGTPPDPQIVVPRASVLGRIALPRHVAGKGVDALQLEPVYHQLSRAEVTLGIRAIDSE